LITHHTSSALDTETYGLIFISNQISQWLTYTKHGYTISVCLKSLILSARVPPPWWGYPASDTLRF